MDHPIESIRGIKSKKLEGKLVLLCTTGSIAAVESIKVSRELIRYGARVIPVMTPSAQEIIHPYALSCATGEDVITTLTGNIEHVKFCGDVQDKADMVLVAPCTANTLSKIALGIADNPVTTCVLCALGSHIPILVVPAMHSAMYRHPRLEEHVSSCKKMGIEIISPHQAEGKAKIVSPLEIAFPVIRMLGDHVLQGKKVLILGGATTEFIDDVRIITNLSSGKMALALATQAYALGATVTLWYGYGAGCSSHPPSFLDTKTYYTSDDLISLIDTSSHFDTIINCAAISDYTPCKKKGKIPSGQHLTLQFMPTPIINKKLRSKTSLLVGFKLESTKEKIVEKAYSRLGEQKLDYIIANTLDTLGEDTISLWLIGPDKTTLAKQGTKNDMAEFILRTIHG